MPKGPNPTSAEIRDDLIKTLRMNLVGPWPEGPNQIEVLRSKPSSWYLTGFLVSQLAPVEEKCSPTAAEELEQLADADEAGEGEEEDQPEAAAQTRSFYPSSIGLSFLVGPDAKSLAFTATWGEYRHESAATSGGRPHTVWIRMPRREEKSIDLTSLPEGVSSFPLPSEPQIDLTLVSRTFDADGHHAVDIPQGSRVISAFLVNNRFVLGEYGDEATLFQARLSVACAHGFVARPNLRGRSAAQDYDERVADLQYRDVCEFASGHNVSTEVSRDADGRCRTVCTTWIPGHEVERVDHVDITGVSLSMDALAEAPAFADLEKGLMPLVSQYREFLETQAAEQAFTGKRKETAQELFVQARRMSTRVEEGIALLAQEPVRYAFQQANRSMAMAARQRMGVHEGKDPQSIKPAWRPFQLAFVLMNLPGISDRRRQDGSLSGIGRLHLGLAAALESRHQRGRRFRHHALYPASLDPGSIGPGRLAHLRHGTVAGKG
jgi:hypothetical protein